MMNSDHEYIDNLISQTEETKSLFSNPRKREREVRIVRALLRLFSKSFREEELLAVPGEPVDVRVAGADFQVTEILEEDRERHREINERLDRYRSAQSIQDILEPITPGVPSSLTPRRIEADEFIARLSAALGAKEARYGTQACASLDALVYLNLQAAVLSPDLRNNVLHIPAGTPWRSVSVLSDDRGLVATARSSAPDFLRVRLGHAAEIWTQPSGLWEL